MDYLPHLICALLGLAITSALIPVIQKRSAAASERLRVRTFHHTHAHKESVSRLGGIALAAAFIAVATLVLIFNADVDPTRSRTRFVIIFSSLAMFSLGLWDDLRPLGARKKLFGQVLIAASVCFSGVLIERFQNPVTGRLYELGAWAWPVTIFWLVGLTNVINLVDGIDGLAGGIGLMLMGLLTFVRLDEQLFPVLCAAGMAGALLGFLRYNFPPAKIYMGDGGAYFLGFLIAILTLVHSQKGTILAALIAPLFALALPIADVSLAILRRGLRGLPIFRADREHIHHRMMKFGFSRTRTVLVLYALSAVFLALAFVVMWSHGKNLPILLGFVFLTLLLAARMFDFSRHWFAMGRVLENSLELRKETHHALALARWLELAAEREPLLENLWNDFVFTAKKMRLSRATLALADGERTWSENDFLRAADGFSCTHDLGGDEVMRLTVEGDEAEMSVKIFEHLSELAAESWLKAATRWQQTTGGELRFKPPQVVTSESATRHIRKPAA